MCAIAPFASVQHCAPLKRFSFVAFPGEDLERDLNYLAETKQTPFQVSHERVSIAQGVNQCTFSG